jgi:putative hydrolase of the HAD superfamily
MTAQCVLFDLDNTLTDRRQSITNFTHRFRRQFAGALGEMRFEQLEEIMQRGDNLGYKPKSQMFLELVSTLPWREPPSVDIIRDFWYAESPGCMQAATYRRVGDTHNAA